MTGLRWCSRTGLVALALVFAGVSTAQAVPFYANENAVECDTNLTNRAADVIQTAIGPGCPGSGSRLTPDDLAQQYRGFFATQGFDLNFLTWAQAVPDFDPNTARWAACGPVAHAFVAQHLNQTCPGGVLHFGPVSDDLVDRRLHVLLSNGSFIALACGNFSEVRPSASPVPTISGTKFDDRNNNGAHESGEAPISGVVIHLFRNGGEVASTPTDANGYYAFALDVVSHPDRGPGTYTLSEDVPSGYHQTAAPGAIVVAANPAPGDLGHPGNDFLNAKAQPTISTVPSGAVHVGAKIHDSATLSGGVSPSGVVTFTLYGPDDASCTTAIGTATGTLAGGTTVSGDLAALQPGVYRWIASYPGDGANYDATSPCGSETVRLYPPITATPTDVTGVEGAPFTKKVASFTDPDPDSLPAEYVATIDWGDGTPTSDGAITQPGGAGTQFSVAGAHTYEEEAPPSGPYAVTVKITEIGNAFNSATVTPHAAIVDAPLTGTPVVVTATEGLPFTGVSVGTFTDADPHGTVSDFTATIRWGDGTPSSTGTVSGVGGGTFTVRGGHTYLTSGTFTIIVKIDDEGGASTTITEPVTVFHAFCTGTLTATDPAHVITGTISGALNLSGGTWVILNAKVLGAVKVSAGTSLLVSHSTLNSAIIGAAGGELIVSDSTVLGAITVEARQPAAVCHSTVNGALAARSGPDGLHACASTIAGAITVSGSTDLVLIGDPSKDCAPNKLTTSGTIVFSDDRAGIDLTGNTLYGSLRVSTSGGTSAPRIAGNTLAGTLGCDGNTPPPVNGGMPNKAGGAKTGQCAAL